MNNFAYIWKSALGWAVVSGSIAGIKRFDFGYCEKSELLKESKNHYHKIPALCLGEIVRMNKVKELTAIDSSPSWMRIAVKQID